MQPDVGTATPHGWWIVASQEIRDLWLGPRGLVILLAYSLLLSAMSYLAASDAQLNLLDARESVNVVVQLAIGLGTLAALVVSADAISGERERRTLEALLVTPLSRRDLVTGKLAAASTIWVAAMLVAVPYVFTLAQGTRVVADAVAVLVVVGSLVAMALTALGIAVSAVASSNRVSLASAIVILLVLAAPSRIPGVTSRGPIGWLLVRANPVSAGLDFASRVLLNQETWASQWTLLIAPAIAAIALTAIAILASRRVTLGGAQ